MPILTSRKTVRTRMATRIKAAVTTLVEVYDHQVKDFGGRSPVLTIHSDGTRSTFPDYTREYHSFILSLWWKRTDDDATEDYIDDLGKDVRQWLIDNTADAGYWHDLSFDDVGDGEGGRSQMDYVLLDGVMYRREMIRVTALVISA